MMKLDNKGKILLAIVAVIFVIFNVVFFLVADSTEINTTTIISWGFMIAGFASFLLFAYLSASKKGMPSTMFMRMTLFGHCALYLIVDFVLAIFFTALGSFVIIPHIWTVLVQLVVLGVHITIALICLMTKAAIEDLGKEVKQKTSRMKNFRVDAEMLIEYCTDAAAKEDFRKFAEAVRFSDPMSCDALNDVEDSLEQILSEMKYHLLEGEVQEAQNKCKIASTLLKERNKKCLMFK